MTEDKLLNYEDGKLLYDDLRGRIDNKKTTPPGGKAGQVLKKKSNKSYDVKWDDESGGVQDVLLDNNSIINDSNNKAYLLSSDIVYDGLKGVADGRSYSLDYEAKIRQLIGAIASTDYATDYEPGTIRPSTGLTVGDSGYVSVNIASSEDVKNGTVGYRFLMPSQIKPIVFYGLASAAGKNESSSSNPIGTYTDSAKTAIQKMLGVEPEVVATKVELPIVEEISGTDVAITGEPNIRYKCGEVNTISIVPPSSGSIDVIFTSGSSVAILTLPNTVKMPPWFDASTLETNTIYEILITDGVYGSVMTWQV